LKFHVFLHPTASHEIRAGVAYYNLSFTPCATLTEQDNYKYNSEQDMQDRLLPAGYLG
jgi:hypothetical protein